MGSRAKYLSTETPVRHIAVGAFGSRSRSRRALPVFAFLGTVATFLVLAIAPHDVTAAEAATAASRVETPQTLSVSAVTAAAVTRDSYHVTTRATARPPSVAPAAVGTPDPGTAQAIGLELTTARGWGADQFACLVALFNRESHWNVYAANPSGAYGIPQALPGSKMASAGADWATNPRTQITWGLNYIGARYLTPCGAWEHSQAKGWY